MSTPEIDKQLLEYLKDGKERRAKDSEKLDALMEATRHNTNAINLLKQSTEADSKLVQHQIAGMNARISSLEEDAADTGIHNIESLREKVKEERDAKGRILGYIITAMGAVGLATMSGAGVVIWYLITKAH